MGEYDFLTNSPSKSLTEGKRKNTEGKRKNPPIIVRSGGELSAKAISRELEKESINMAELNRADQQSDQRTALDKAEREEMMERAEGREAAARAKEAYDARIKALEDAIGPEYKRDLIMQPPMWAAQDLQPGYGSRQDRQAAQIMSVELARIVRVLDASGYCVTKDQNKSPET